MSTGKRITLATIKSFIKRNREDLMINVRSRFDGMTDGCETVKGGFKKAIPTTSHLDNTLGIDNAWFVGSGRDNFYPYEKDGMTGYEIYNCCGTFILATED